MVRIYRLSYRHQFINRWLCATSAANRLLMIIALFILSSSCSAQFKAIPPLVSSHTERLLRTALAQTTIPAIRMELSLQLACFYIFQPMNKPPDSQRAMSHLQSADRLSSTLGSRDAQNRVLWLKSCLLAAQLKFDEAEALCAQASDSTRLLMMINVAYRRLEIPGGPTVLQLKKAKLLLDRSFQLLDSVRHPQIFMTWYFVKADLLMFQNAMPAAERMFNNMLDFAARRRCLPNPELYIGLMAVYRNQGKSDQALQVALRLLEQVNHSADTANVGNAYYLLSIIFNDRGQLEKARENNDKAIDSFRKYWSDFGSFWTCIDIRLRSFFRQRRYEEALHFLQEQARLCPPKSFIDRQTFLGGMGDCYLKCKFFDKAEPFFLEEFNNARQHQAVDESVYHRMAFFYVESGQFPKAYPYLDSALANFAGVSEGTKAHLYHMHFTVDSATGNFNSAMLFLKKNKISNDTIRHRTRQTEERNSQQIKLLEKQNELQGIAGQHAEWTRKISVLAVPGILAAILIFYRQYHKRLKMARLIDTKDQQMELLLREKDWLLKEVHHRVKNNLQTIVALLEMQAEFLEGDALDAIENSQHRIYAMSLLHQKLYAEDANATINVSSYVRELVNYLNKSFSHEKRIELQLNLDHVEAELSIAVPLGLIINEAISNVYKYAFPDYWQNAMIIISLRRFVNCIEVTLADNGVGLLKTNIMKDESLGIKLIRGLAKEMDATVNIIVGRGTVIRITIPMEEAPAAGT